MKEIDFSKQILKYKEDGLSLMKSRLPAQLQTRSRVEQRIKKVRAHKRIHGRS